MPAGDILYMDYSFKNWIFFSGKKKEAVVKTTALMHVQF